MQNHLMASTRRHATSAVGGLDNLSTFLVVEKGVSSSADEDSYAYSFGENLGIIGVFDGCGGLGARRYQMADMRTGAYLSSRIVAETSLSWFDQMCVTYQHGGPLAEQADSLREALSIALSQKAGMLTEASSVRMSGSMVKTLPSTMVAAVLDYGSAEQTAICFYWAGDSRGYTMDHAGLRQLTRDHTTTIGDPMDSMRLDAALSNHLCADCDFKVEAVEVRLLNPGLVLCATDGAYGYIGSPMELEYSLLDTLMRSDSIESWESLLHLAFMKVAGDDYSLLLAAFGFSRFKDLKDYYSERYAYMKKTYADPIHQASLVGQDVRKELWSTYKLGYIGYE